jgi:hypothetical protein
MLRVFSAMRVVSYMVVLMVLGTSIGYGLGINPIIPMGALGAVSFIPLGVDQNCLCTLLGTHTGQVAYTGSIDSPIARLYIDADSATALGTVTAAKLSLSQATKKRTGTIIPELPFSVLADIAGYIDAIYYQYTATFRIKFSIPIGGGPAYDPEGGSLTYNLSNCTAADTIKVYCIDDARRGQSYIEIVPIACLAGGVKQIDCTYANWLFIDPSNLTRVKVNYAGGLSIEYVGEELDEIARLVNPVHKVTDAGILSAGTITNAGLNIQDAVSCEVNLTAAGTVYLVKQLLAV